MTSTTNTNVRGSSASRRARREWLVMTFRADVDVTIQIVGGTVKRTPATPACRCYRCGVLLTVDTVTVDRIIPGILGGTYRRNNIRPACGPCNYGTGGRLGNERRRVKA